MADTSQCHGAVSQGGRRRARRALVISTAILALSAFTIAGALAQTKAAGKATKLHLTALVTADNVIPKKGAKLVLSLKDGKKTVGGATFPGCQGAGTDVDCGGTVSIKGLGTGLQTLVVFSCPTTPPFTCKPGKGVLVTKAGNKKGTILLKVQPSKLKKGARFPVVVIEG